MLSVVTVKTRLEINLKSKSRWRLFIVLIKVLQCFLSTQFNTIQYLVFIALARYVWFSLWMLSCNVFVNTNIENWGWIYECALKSSWNHRQDWEWHVVNFLTVIVSRANTTSELCSQNSLRSFKGFYVFIQAKRNQRFYNGLYKGKVRLC